MSKRTNKGPWLHSVKATRREAAELRQTAYNKLSVKEKLALLDRGNFVSTKQRTKLEKLLTK